MRCPKVSIHVPTHTGNTMINSRLLLQLMLVLFLLGLACGLALALWGGV